MNLKHLVIDLAICIPISAFVFGVQSAFWQGIVCGCLYITGKFVGAKRGGL